MIDVITKLERGHPLRVALWTDRVLVALRELAARRLPALLAPLGFAARVGG